MLKALQDGTRSLATKSIMIKTQCHIEQYVTILRLDLETFHVGVKCIQELFLRKVAVGQVLDTQNIGRVEFYNLFEHSDSKIDVVGFLVNIGDVVHGVDVVRVQSQTVSVDVQCEVIQPQPPQDHA